MEVHDLNTLPEIRWLKLQPFQDVDSCPKCGMSRSWLPLWVLRFIGKLSTDFKVAYCKGGEEPEKDIMVLPGFSQTVKPICAGVGREHLHLQCVHCGHTFLMETRE